MCVLGRCQETCEDAPHDFQARKPVTGPYVGQYELRRDQHEAVAYVEVGHKAGVCVSKGDEYRMVDGLVELIAIELEILLHA